VGDQIVTLSLDTLIPPKHAGEVCRVLIRAPAADPQQVDRADVPTALTEAMAAVGPAPGYRDAASRSSPSENEMWGDTPW
jgi:hypothetical protein